MTIDPETKKYIDDTTGLQNIKISSVIASIFEILEKKNVVEPGEWEKTLEKSRAMANLALMFGVQEFTDKVTKQANDDEKLR